MPTRIQICLSESRASATSLADDIHVASEAGFSALDLWALKLEDCLSTYPPIWLDMQMQEHHVYALSVSGLELPAWDNKAERLVHEARFLELGTHLDALGGAVIVVWPGMAFEGQADRLRDAAGLVRMLRSYSDLVAPFEVRIALEFQVTEHSAVRTLVASHELVRQVGRNNVGLAFDIAQLRHSRDRLEAVAALDVNKLWLVRLESSALESSASAGQHPLAEEKDGLVARTLQQAICKELAAKGFYGPYSLEWPSGVPSDPEDAAHTALIERARQARQATLEWLASLYA